MPQLENTVSLTIVRLGEAVPVVFFSSAVDFILLVCAGGRQLLGRTAVDRRQLTGKMKSTALAIGMPGTASPRRTIVLSLAKANSVILESPERDVKRPFRPKSSTVLGGTHRGTSAALPLFVFYSERWLRPIASTVNHVVDRGLNPQPSG